VIIPVMDLDISYELCDDIKNIVRAQNLKLLRLICDKYKWDIDAFMHLID
jgi:hypothetical protein